MTNKKCSSEKDIASTFQNNKTLFQRFAQRFTSNKFDVDDICQEAVLRALEAEKDRKIREPRAFIYGIIRNVVRKRLERQSRSVIDYIADFCPDEHLHYGPSVEAHIDDRARMALFTEAVSTLPPQCQRVFVLKKVYGYAHKEIAQKLNISTSTVEKHVAAGLKRCLEHMQRHSETHALTATNTKVEHKSRLIAHK